MFDVCGLRGNDEEDDQLYSYTRTDVLAQAVKMEKIFAKPFVKAVPGCFAAQRP